MPKSKEQKQKEALERAREHIIQDRAEMLRFQVGGEFYLSNVLLAGVHDANEKARAARKKFEQKCAEAKVDTHGNPI